MEKFLTLLPPMFTEKGEVGTLEEVVKNMRWLATVNLWLVRESPTPAILYQQRSTTRKWAPGKLDVVVGGKVNSKESIFEALQRESKEELNLEVSEQDCLFVGRKLGAGILHDNFLYTVPHIFFKKDNRDLRVFTLQEDEVSGIFALDLDLLIDLHMGKLHSFKTTGLNAQKEAFEIEVDLTMFPENFDNYHKRIALLAKRWLEGEKVEYWENPPEKR